MEGELGTGAAESKAMGHHHTPCRCLHSAFGGSAFPGHAAVCSIYRPAPAPPAQHCPCCSLFLGMATMHHTSLLHIGLDFSWGILSRCKLGQSCCSTLQVTDLIIQPSPHSKCLPPPDELNYLVLGSLFRKIIITSGKRYFSRTHSG